jgi:hypothetical protein
MPRFIAAILIFLCVAASSASGMFLRGGYGVTAGLGGAFAKLAVGGGGFITNLAIAPDGTQLARTDTGGVFTRPSHTAKWAQILTAYTMPAADQYPGNSMGACEIAIAPSKSSHFYMYYAPNAGTPTASYLYASTDSGAHWSRVGAATFPTTDVCPANDQASPSYRLHAPYMGVSPANENVVYVGTHASGVYYSLDGGATWTQISTATIPAGGVAGDTNQGNLISFDTSDLTGNTVYITSYGTGIWKCTAALTVPSCTELNSAGMPTAFNFLNVDQLGTVWAVDGSQNLQRYLTGAWSTQLSGINNGVSSVAVDPANSSYAIAAIGSGCIYYSNNAQAATPTWSGSASNPTCYNGGVQSTVIPWIQWAADSFLSLGILVFDPTQSHQVYGANGDGVFKATAPTTGTAITWNADESAGIENLDLQASSIGLSSGGLGFAAQDRPAWFMGSPSTYSSQYYPNNASIIRYGDSVCGYSTANTYGNINNNNGLSVSSTGYNGAYSVSGTTGLPAGFVAGQCVMLTSTNWIWMGGVPSTISGLGTITGGSGYTNGTYSNVPLTGGSGTGATANITVSGGAVAVVAIVHPGQNYVANPTPDVLSAAASSIGGTGSGFSVPVSSVSSQPQPYFTNNSGTGWGSCTFGASGKTADGGGWITLAQDSAGNVVLYNDGSGIANGAGAAGSWESASTTACAFTQKSTTKPDGLASTLIPVPGHACNFILASIAYVWGGLPAGYGTVNLTQDCGATWAAVPGINSLLRVGLGAAQLGHDGYTSLYYVGWYNNGVTNTFSIWEVDNIDSTPVFTDLDAAHSGTQKGFPCGSMDVVMFIQGDAVTAGEVYFGFGGSGGCYRTN